MKVSGEDLISRPTRLSSRATLISCAIIFVVQTEGLDVNSIQVLGVKAVDGLFQRLASYYIVFLAVNHVVLWVGDVLNVKFIKTKTDYEALRAEIEKDYGEKGYSNVLAPYEKQLGLIGTTFSVYQRFYVYIWFLTLPLLACVVALNSVIQKFG